MASLADWVKWDYDKEYTRLIVMLLQLQGAGYLTERQVRELLPFDLPETED